MIDTATLVLHTSNPRIKEEFEQKRKVPKRNKNNSTSYYYEGLSHFGIKHMRMCYQKDYPGLVHIFIKLNFRELLGVRSPVYLCVEEDFPIIAQNFFNCIKSEFQYLPCNIFDWSVNRIDYCVNAYTEYASEYIELLHHADRIYRKVNDPIKQETYDKRAYGYLWKGSYWYMVSNFYCFNIYDKHDQLSKKDNVDKSLLEESLNLLRFEIQCHAPFVQQIKRGMARKRENTLETFFNKEISEVILFSKLNRIMPAADFVRRKQAVQAIQHMRTTEVRKEEYLSILGYVNSRNGNLIKAKKKYGADKVRALRDNLKRRNMNIITIPDTKRLEGISYSQGLPSLQKVLQEALRRIA